MKKISCCFSEIRLLSYGASAGDLEVTKYSGATERVSPLIPVPHGLPLHNSAIYNSLYVSHLYLFMCCRAVLYCKYQEFRPPPRNMAHYNYFEDNYWQTWATLDLSSITLLCQYFQKNWATLSPFVHSRSI